MFLQKLRSFSFSSNPKIPRNNDKKHHRRRKSLRTPNSEHRNPLSPSTTNSTKDSHTSQRKTNICAEATDIIKENNGEGEKNGEGENHREGENHGEGENQEGRDFREYLEKCRKAEEAEERKRKKMAEKRKEVNLSPWARRM
ncbi:1be5a4ff-3262-4477-9bf8-13d17c264d47-CDS [Sclerotinia trifoliorum]|uniref:1be5a4ff-3262-4477-9bf8-13d17c264d47-CDS n=1 Tax=Sclerotinia trifoliorum TaxID=28548 RepID=A0A8H2ZN71_9HELO|nr:1be5a4ff-3262-4477-9bf8-13d17c264d47-CDS [Sclerotinia trifoliorum]